MATTPVFNVLTYTILAHYNTKVNTCLVPRNLYTEPYITSRLTTTIRAGGVQELGVMRVR